MALSKLEYLKRAQEYRVPMETALRLLRETEVAMEGLRGNPPGVALSKLLVEAVKVKRASIPTAEEPVLNTGQ